MCAVGDILAAKSNDENIKKWVQGLTKGSEETLHLPNVGLVIRWMCRRSTEPAFTSR